MTSTPFDLTPLGPPLSWLGLATKSQRQHAWRNEP